MFAGTFLKGGRNKQKIIILCRTLMIHSLYIKNIYIANATTYPINPISQMYTNKCASRKCGLYKLLCFIQHVVIPVDALLQMFILTVDRETGGCTRERQYRPLFARIQPQPLLSSRFGIKHVMIIERFEKFRFNKVYIIRVPEGTEWIPLLRVAGRSVAPYPGLITES